MSRGALAAVLLAALAAPAALAAGDGPAPQLRLDFATPAQLGGDASLGRGGWLLLVFSPDSSAALALDAAGPVAGANHTQAAVTTTGLAQGRQPVERDPAPVNVPDGLDATLGFGPSWASLYVQADAIRLDVTASLALGPSTGQRDAADFLPAQERPPGQVRPGGDAPPGVVASLGPQAQAAAVPFFLRAEGLRRVEWHNATVGCAASPCPDGAHTTVTRVPTALGEADLEQVPFLELRMGGGTLSGGGTGFVAAFGGASVDLALDGSARFPEAVVAGCEAPRCEDPAGRTFLAEGRLNLTGLAQSPGNPDRLSGGLDARLSQASIDERPAPSLLGRAAAGTAAVAATALILKVLLTLFARNTRPLLDHPRTKALHDLVHAEPGLSFGQLRARLELGHGTTHYHLQRLLKAGLVVAYGYRNTVRYYENHGKHKHDWQEHAALHKPELRALHAWVAERPRSTQSQVVAAAARWGWKRSRTQNYLRQLVEAALLRAERTPSGVEYVALKPAASAPLADAADAPSNPSAGSGAPLST